MPVSITCPQCRATMRSPSPVPVGKRVKCPKCLSVFGVPAQQGAPSAEPSTQGQTVASRSRRRAGRRKFLLVLAGFFILVALSSGGYLYLHGDAATSSASSASLPSPSSSPSVALSSAASKPTQPAPAQITDDPLAYLPADSSLIMGFDAATLGQLAVVKDSGDVALRSGQAEPWIAELQRSTGLKMEDLERCVIAATGELTAERPECVVLVVRSRKPLAANQLAQLPDVLKTKTAGGRPYHTLSATALSLAYEVRACCTPIDRLVVVALGRAKRVEAVMGAAGTAPTMSPELVPLLRKVEKTQVWAVALLDAASRQRAEAMLPMLLNQAPAEVQESLKSLAQARAAGVWVSTDAKEVSISAGVLLPDAAMAQNLAGSLGGAWNKSKQRLQEQFQPIIKELPADLRALVDDVLKTSAITAEGPLAHASVRLNLAPIEGLVKAIKTMGPQALLASIEQARAKGLAGAVPPDAGPHEKALLAQINKTRDAEKVPPYKGDQKLFTAAQRLAKVAAKDGGFMNVDLQMLTDAVKDSGYTAVNFTYNYVIAPGQDQVDPRLVVEKWLSDEAAKIKLLSREYQECGIGIAAGETELFIIFVMATPQRQ